MNRFYIIAIVIIQLNSDLAAQPGINAEYFQKDSVIVFLPFLDESGFNGKWDIQNDIPRFLSVYCRERFQIGVVNPLVVVQFAGSQQIDIKKISGYSSLQKIADHFKVRYIVSAVIEECTVDRFIVGDQLTAGYEAFSGEIKLRFSVYDAIYINGSGKKLLLYEGISIGSVKDRSLGITLFGKQTDRTNQYYSLDDLSFGSETFNKTIIGEAMLACADDLASKLERCIPNLSSKVTLLPGSVELDSARTDSSIYLRRQLIKGEIVIVEGNEVFINLGIGDGLRVGDILSVFEESTDVIDPQSGEVLGRKDEKVGEVQIIELRAEHLSLATIVEERTPLKPRHKIRKVLIR